MVNIYKQDFTVLQQEIMRLLFVKVGIALNVRRISQFLEVSAPAVAKALPNLNKKRLVNIQQDTESNRWSIELNRNSHSVMQLKRADNLKQIYETGLADLLEKEFAGATIIIFGSYSRGEDVAKSDIDVAIVGRKSKSIDLTKFNDLLERKIIINFYDSFDKIHKNLKENLCNGIVLSGGVEL